MFAKHFCDLIFCFMRPSKGQSLNANTTGHDCKKHKILEFGFEALTKPWIGGKALTPPW